MEYRTVYSILDESARVPWTHVSIGLFGLPVAVLLEWRKRNWGMLGVVAVFGLVWNGALLPPS